MGISYENASSNLLCAEESNIFIGFDEGEDDAERLWSDSYSLQAKSCRLDGNFFKIFSRQSDECLEMLLEREAEHMPKEDYTKQLLNGCLDASIRTSSIDWILKVHAYYNFGPLSACLSINYLDRFLSVYELPQGKAWMTQLISVACLSLAAKMEEEVVPLLLDLQIGDAKFVFEPRTIQRMELLLLSTLKWKMHIVTPFSYIECFLRMIDGGDMPSEPSLSRSVELILRSIKGISFLSFKPSEIAAATALCVKGAANAYNFDKTFTYSSKTDMERVLRCYQLMEEEIVMTSGISASGTHVPQSPIGVIDAACLIYKSDETTSESQQSSRRSSPADKKRKICSRPPIISLRRKGFHYFDFYIQ